jgi:hypothetical protein
LVEIANSDRIGRLNAGRIPNGTILVSVLNGPSLIIKAEHGSLEAFKGSINNPRASMIFKDLESANSILNGKIDSYTALATGQLQVNGYIPMIDNMNKLLAQVPGYLI